MSFVSCRISRGQGKGGGGRGSAQRNRKLRPGGSGRSLLPGMGMNQKWRGGRKAKNKGVEERREVEGLELGWATTTTTGERRREFPGAVDWCREGEEGGASVWKI